MLSICQHFHCSLFIYAGCSMDTYELLVDSETYRKHEAAPDVTMSPLAVLPFSMSASCCLWKAWRAPAVVGVSGMQAQLTALAPDGELQKVLVICK